MKLPKGERIPLDIEDSATIGDILVKFEDKGFDPNCSSLLYEGRDLERDKLFSSYLLPGKSTLHLMSTSQVALPEKANECDSAMKASIIDFYPVSDYHTYKPPSFCNIKDMLKNGVMESVEQKGAPAFRWIHLPSNNMFWVEVGIAVQPSRILLLANNTLKKRLIDAIYIEQGLKKPPKKNDPEDRGSTADKGKGKAKGVDTPKPGDTKMAAQLLLRPHYWARQQFVSRKSQGDVQSRFMKPCFSRISDSR